MLIRNAPGSAPALPELHRRLRWVVVAVVTAFAALVGRLWQLQIVRGDEYYEEALSNVVQKRFLPSVRGRLLDRDGEPLADNRPAFNIYVTPKSFDDVAPVLVRLLGLSEEEQELMAQRIASARERKARQLQLVLDDQGGERAALVEQASFRLAGVAVRHEPRRRYPHGDLAAHIIGYMNKMTAREADEYRQLGYQEWELIGRDGLEREWENHLRGKKGVENYVVNARGQRIEGPDADGLIEGARMVPPVGGHDVVLTLDVELQKLAEQAVRRHPAAAVAVVEVNTGRILALVSKPSFDPNIMTGHLTRAEKALMDADPRKPFLDKTLQQHYPPGSIFKFVTAIAALEDGAVGEEEVLYCPGYHEQSGQKFKCTSSHKKQNVIEATQHSCNVYFWKLAERIGIDRMAEVARDFGFGASTGLGLNGDVSGRMPTRAWYETHTTFKIGYTLNAATGQGDVEVTVLQMAMAYAALANRGALYVPQIVARVDTAAGETLFEYQPKLRRRLQVSPESFDILHRGMHRVVNELGGTAFERGHSEIVDYSGKTGTAQVRGKRAKKIEIEGWHPHREHAWFAGFAPAVNPEIAIVVLIEHGGSGGKVAAPVAKVIIEKYFTKVKPASGADPGAGGSP